MNSVQIISQAAAALKAEHLKRQLNSPLKKNDTLSRYFSVVVDLKQDPKQMINWEDCHYYWASPQQGEYLGGFDTCVSISTTGEQRFQKLYEQYQLVLKNWSPTQNESYIDFQHCQQNFQQNTQQNEQQNKNRETPESNKYNEQAIAFCAFTFDADDPMTDIWQDFPNMELNIPQILFQIHSGKSHLIINIDTHQKWDEHILLKRLEEILKPDNEQATSLHPKEPIFIKKQTKTANDHARKNWFQLVEQALHTISLGITHKLVPSRHVRYQQDEALLNQETVRGSQRESACEPSKGLLSRLQQLYPSCHILSIRKGASRLIAASPERLLKITGDQVFCNAIGGTLKRSKGQSIVKLLRHNSQGIDKLLHEHAIIAEHIYNVLDDFCETIKMPTAPGIMKLKHLVHLETPIYARLKESTNPLQLAEKLHPTPAVAGFPIPEAMQWLKKNESHQRGLYTGAMGWLSPSGAGELSVILRCALLSTKVSKRVSTKVTENGSEQASEKNTKHYLDLFAGAGIVENSTPAEEWAETELKLDTILRILK